MRRFAVWCQGSQGPCILSNRTFQYKLQFGQLLVDKYSTVAKWILSPLDP